MDDPCATDRPPMLETRDLCREIAEGDTRRAIVDGVSLVVPRGRFATIMGPSGSGKSTLLHLIAGLEDATSGDVIVDGERWTGLDDAARTAKRLRTLGFVFQFFHLVPHLSVAENIALPLLLAGDPAGREDPRFGRIVARLELGAVLEKRPQQLSGGEMQRVSLARALVHEPPLVIADEPTGNLSSRAGREVMELLRAAVDELGRTVLLVTHNPRDAAFADEVHFLCDGRIEDERSLRGESVDESHLAHRLEELGI